MTAIEELKNSFLVKDCGCSLKLSAETYDDMNNNTYYQDALKKDSRMNLFDILDEVTSDAFIEETGNDYFYLLHSSIIGQHFNGDLTWDDAVKHWSPEDIRRAKEAAE